MLEHFSFFNQNDAAFKMPEYERLALEIVFTLFKSEEGFLHSDLDKLQKLHPGFSKKIFQDLPRLQESAHAVRVLTGHPYGNYLYAYSRKSIGESVFKTQLSLCMTDRLFYDLGAYEFCELLLKEEQFHTVDMLLTWDVLSKMSKPIMCRAYDIKLQAMCYLYTKKDAVLHIKQMQEEVKKIPALVDTSVVHLWDGILAFYAKEYAAADWSFEAARAKDGNINGNSFGVFSYMDELPVHRVSVANEFTVLKRAQQNDNIYVAACDQNYFDKYAHRFIDSLPQDRCIHLHIINADNDSCLKKFENYANVGISTSQYHGKHAKSYYAFARFIFLADIMDIYGGNLIVSDIDIEYRDHDITDVVAGEYDLSVCERTNDLLFAPWNSITALLLVCKSSGCAHELSQAAVRFFYSHLESKHNLWWIDQNFLEVYCRTKKTNNIYLLARAITQLI